MAISKIEVARKIFEGELITEEEFEVAKANGFYKADAQYVNLKATHYTGPKRYGYICTAHETASDGAKTDGEGRQYECGFGLHVPDLNRSHLTLENKVFLVKRFGKDVIDRIPK